MDLILLDNIISLGNFKSILTLFALIAGIFVITARNPIISIFNLIVLYILVAFYLMYIGITYIGISYIIIYVGAIAILFLFIVMMIDIEVLPTPLKGRNAVPLMLFILGGFLLTFRKFVQYLGLINIKSISFYPFYMKEIAFNDILIPVNLLNLSCIENTYNGVYPDNIFNLEDMSFASYTQVGSSDDSKNTGQDNYSSSDEEDSEGDLLEDINIVRGEDDIQTIEYDSKGLDWCKNEYDNEGVMNLIKYWEKQFKFEEKENFKDEKLIIKDENKLNSYEIKDNNSTEVHSINEEEFSNYLGLGSESIWETHNVGINSGWESLVGGVTQIAAIGDILYSTYYPFLYILSILLLLGMVGAIILTGDNKHEVKFIRVIKDEELSHQSVTSPTNTNINNNKISGLCGFVLPVFPSLIEIYFQYEIGKWILFLLILVLIFDYRLYFEKKEFLFRKKICKRQVLVKSYMPFNIISQEVNNKSIGIMKKLINFIIFSIIIGILLLFINTNFSLKLSYTEKGGGFECGFTSFFQTRERFHVVFYKVGLLFLMFDLEIFVTFPFPVAVDRNQAIVKNNALVFLLLLMIGLTFEIKEGALDLVKIKRSTDILIDNMET